MTVYLINIFLILFWGYVFLYKYRSEKNTKAYCAIVAFQWILISGFRHWSIGADTIQYIRAFERIKNKSWPEIWSNLWNYLFNGLEIKDPGYDLFQKLFQILFNDHQFFLLFVAALFTSIMAVWIYKNSSMPEISFLLYSVLFYSFYAVTGTRQTIATALTVFCGYKYIKERKLFKFALLAFVAFLIHKSSIVFAPFYFIANIPITPIYIIIALCTILIIVLGGKPLYGAVAESLGFGEGQINYDVGGAETYALVLTLACIVVLLMYKFYKNRREDSTQLFNITLLTLLSSLLVFQNQSFMRIQQYYSLFLMITLPEVVLSFDKRAKLFTYLGSIFFLILYLITNNPEYKFFWQ